jgi:hypothetical protein
MKRLVSLVAVASICGAGIAVLPASAHRAHTPAATLIKLQVRKGKLGRYVVDGEGPDALSVREGQERQERLLRELRQGLGAADHIR